jgi:hypothetical protein
MLEIPAELSDNALLLEKANFQVTKEADVELALAWVVEAENRIAAVTGVISPIRKSIRDLEERARNITRPLKTVADTLRNRVAKFWDDRQAKLDAEEKAKRDAEAEEEKKRLDQAMKVAVATGDEKAMTEVANREKNLEKLKQPVEVSQTVRTRGFTGSQAKFWDWKVIDESKVPKDFWILDEKKLNRIAKGYGKTKELVPGIEFSERSRVVLKS